MGNGCCMTKDVNTDLRDRERFDREGRGRDRSQNTFKKKLAEPEFKVERRESIGLAAKEHTAMLLTNKNSMVEPGAGDDNDTRGSKQTEQAPRESGEDFAMNEGTFNENSCILTENKDGNNSGIQRMSNSLMKSSRDAYDADPRNSMEHHQGVTVSFGGISNQDREEFDESKGEGLVASFGGNSQTRFPEEQHTYVNPNAAKRITFGADKVPASPATTDAQKIEDHFK